MEKIVGIVEDVEVKTTKSNWGERTLYKFKIGENIYSVFEKKDQNIYSEISKGNKVAVEYEFSDDGKYRNIKHIIVIEKETKEPTLNDFNVFRKGDSEIKEYWEEKDRRITKMWALGQAMGKHNAEISKMTKKEKAILNWDKDKELIFKVARDLIEEANKK